MGNAGIRLFEPPAPAISAHRKGSARVLTAILSAAHHSSAFGPAPAGMFDRCSERASIRVKQISRLVLPLAACPLAAVAVLAQERELLEAQSLRFLNGT